MAPQPGPWRTLLLPHFRIHFHPGGEGAADHLAALAEPALAEIAHLLGHLPADPIHVVLTDETDGANGFAQTLPRNRITLYLGVPEPFGTLGDFDDYQRLLFIHELTHVVHLDTIGGLARVANEVLGKTFAPNQIQPRWFIEGLAVYVESRLSSGGRVRSALVDMFMRAQILEDRFLAIDEMSTQTRRYPGGTVAWDFGGRFLDFIARRHGEDALAAMSQSYGSRFIPYAINVVAEEATEESFVELWDAWREDEERRALPVLERIRAEGVREGALIPRPAEELYRPRFAPTGELLLLEAPRDGDFEMVVLALDRRTERLRLRTANGSAAFTPDGRRVVAAQAEVHRTVYSYTDLEIIELDSGECRRRTFGARLDQPDVSPDGRTIVAVAQGGGRTWLAALPLEGEQPPEVLWQPGPGEHVAHPRYSPDGRSLALSLHRPDGSRAIALLDLETRTLSLLTSGRAQDLDPEWERDGRGLVFSSDRGGVYNLHRVGRDGRMERLTNVATGAFAPAIDPRSGALWYLQGTFGGYELRVLGPERPPLEVLAPKLRPTASASVGVSRPAEEPYQLWDSLMPSAYLPTTGFDGLGETLGVLLSGDDVLAQHFYQLQLEYGFSSRRLGYSFFYSNRTLSTPFNLASSLTTTLRPTSFAPPPEQERLETIWRADVGIDLPLPRWDSGLNFSMRYGVELRRGPQLLSDDPFQPSPATTGDLTLGTLGLSLSFSSVRGSADSISAERGVSFDVSLELHDPLLGSDLRVLGVTAHLQAFLQMPWARHHVLALRGALGAAAGDADGRSVYVLGGLPVRNVLRDVVDGGRGGVDVLRGYEQGAFRGNAFYLGTLEYRLPLLDIERGVLSLPGFIDRLYAAAFADAGQTPSGSSRLEEVRAGAGVELRLDLVIGYYVPLTARLGYARGLAAEGIDNFFFVLGNSF